MDKEIGNMVRRKNSMVFKVVSFGFFFIMILLTTLLVSNAASAANDSIHAVNNVLTATTTSLSSFGVSSTGGVLVLKVQTSRYSVFSPWTGKPSAATLSTDFIAYALLIGENGMPVSGQNITFEIYSPAVKKATLYDITKSNGLANASYDTINDFISSGDSDYGTWNITAYLTNDTSIRGTTFMKIEKEGGGMGGGMGGCWMSYCHSSSKKEKGGYPRSPYTEHYNQTETRTEAAHTDNHHINKGCYYCHPGYSVIKTGSYGNTSDVHRNRTCDFCHGTWTYISGTGAGQGKGIPKMPSCYDCHPKYNNNLTNISSLANLAAGNNISVYSYNYDRKAPLTGHNGTNYSFNQSVPCIVCHGPAHNITKPDPLPANRNNITEYAQCTACHSAYSPHNNTVNCTVCHSQDAHVIKIFTQNATYINGSTPSFRGNCTSCHQNSTFMNTLLAQPRAGRYSGPPAPLIQKPMNHSDDALAGAKWGAHWTSQQTACIYWHDNTLHDLTPLGRILQFAPGYQMYGTIDTNTSCSNCHYKGDSNYDQMSSAFTTAGLLIPPEITNGTSWKGISTDYYNHSLATYQDRDCKPCHGSLLSTGANMGEFQHNAGKGTAGGADCKACHDIRGSAGPDRLVNFSAMNSSDAIHKNLNSAAATTLSAENKKCWACHGNGSDPGKKHPSNYMNPYDCEDCHIQGAGQNLNFTPSSILNVSQHYWNGTNIPTVNSCNSCHNKTDMLVGINIDPDGTVDSKNSAHYGKKRIDIRIALNESDCAYCHQDPTSEFSDVFNKSANTQITHDNDKSCYLCHREAGSTDGKIHDASLLGGSGGSCTQCHSATGGATVVGNNDLGLHRNLNTTDGGADTLTDSDCMTCHYQNPHGGPGSSTYYCYDCHTAAGEAPVSIKSTITFTDKKHGQNACIDCHVADGTYHQGNPRGSVANSTYSNRYIPLSGNGIYTDCGDCHYSANLDDAPFNAPGGGVHVKSNGDGTCATGGGASCHAGGTTMVATLHKLSKKNNSNKPAVTIPTLSSPTVAKGSDVMVNTTVSISSLYEFVDGAQYRIMSGTTEIKAWTPMQAVDGNFNGTRENATSTINTSNLNSGNYNIEVRGMGGGPAMNPLIRYYPINGDISTVKNTTLTIESQNGYINGRITNRSGDAIPGAIVSIPGKSTTSAVDGIYSLSVPSGAYDVTASNQPTHTDNTTYGVPVTALNITYANITLDTKLTGTIIGVVTNV